MPNTRKTTTGFIALLILIGSVSGGAYWWLKQPYHYPEAQAVTHQFMALLRAKAYDQAFTMIVRPGLLGNSPQELAQIAEHECLDDSRFVSSHPPQTNGNRLRRWLTQRPVNQTKLNLDFQSSACLLGVQLTLTEKGEWRILRFGGHAG